MVIKLPNEVLSTEILYFTCGACCCLDFCPTATFLQHSPQAGAHHTPAWVRNNIIACAKCPYGSCEFSSILNRSLCRLTSQLYSHLPTASLLQDEHTGLSILSSIYSPKLQQMPPKTTEKKPQ